MTEQRPPSDPLLSAAAAVPAQPPPSPSALPPRLFVVSSNGIVPAWVMPAAAVPAGPRAAPLRGRPAPPAVNRSTPRQRRTRPAGDEWRMPAGRHARGGVTLSWRLAGDAALVVLGLVVLLLAVLAAQPA